jgi:hypothetical protein
MTIAKKATFYGKIHKPAKYSVDDVELGVIAIPSLNAEQDWCSLKNP